MSEWTEEDRDTPYGTTGTFPIGRQGMHRSTTMYRQQKCVRQAMYT